MKKPTKPAEQLLKEREAVRQAIEVYSGPVTRCPPGNARAKTKRSAADRAAQWLAKHWNDPRTVEKRIASAQQQRKRTAKHNAPLIKLLEKRRQKFR